MVSKIADMLGSGLKWLVNGFQKMVDKFSELGDMLMKKLKGMFASLEKRIDDFMAKLRKKDKGHGDGIDNPEASLDEMNDLLDNRPVSERGRKHGQRLKKKDLRQLKKVLKDKYGIDLQIGPESGRIEIDGFFGADGKPSIMPEGAAAMFITDGKNKKMILRDGATNYEVFHEFQHFKHSNEIGLQEYYNLGGKLTPGELIKEQYVFDRIMENRDLFTEEELNHALKYINKVRNSYGKESLEMSFDGAKKVLPLNKISVILNR